MFADDGEGKAQIVVSPLVRLTNKPSAKITDIGTPEGVLESLGPFITGTYLDQEDVVAVGSKDVDGRTYYTYEVCARLTFYHVELELIVVVLAIACR